MTRKYGATEGEDLGIFRDLCHSYEKEENDGLGRVTQKYQGKEDTKGNGVLIENKCSDGF